MLESNTGSAHFRQGRLSQNEVENDYAVESVQEKHIYNDPKVSNHFTILCAVISMMCPPSVNGVFQSTVHTATKEKECKERGYAEEYVSLSAKFVFGPFIFIRFW